MIAASTSGMKPLVKGSPETKKRPDCPCKRVNCKNRGHCKACKANHHNAKRDTPTTCERLNKKKRKLERKDKKADQDETENTNDFKRN